MATGYGERVKRFITSWNALLLLLVLVPVALLLEHVVHAGAAWVFLTSAIAIVPLAGLMGRATEELAHRVGAGLGGLLNATFGNAAELIIAAVALSAGYYDLVKASLAGSIIGNILLVFGLSALIGGLRHPVQKFNRTAASLGGTMLTLSAIGLLVPAIFHILAGEGHTLDERTLSLEIAIVLMASYLLSLLFTLRTHSHLYSGPVDPAADKHSDFGARWSMRTSLLVLVASAAVVALMSEQLVGAVEGAAEVLGMNEVFIGVILVAIVGNAAEHSTAILMAAKNKMDIAFAIAAGSSIQIALFVAPLLVFLSYLIGPAPMDLRFTGLEVFSVGISVGILALIAQDGESHWMEGVQLLAVYAILALAFYYLPV
jgi:Ca2+:H+ antiporter